MKRSAGLKSRATVHGTTHPANDREDRRLVTGDR